MNIKTDILIYTAGYIDGDGCFNIRIEKTKNRYKYPSQLIVTSTNRPILQFFKEHLGGNFHPVNNREKRQREKIQYRFCIVGKKAIEIAQLLFPFLVEKKEQCKCFIDFFNTKTLYGKKVFVEKMKHLKHNSNRVEKKHIDFLKKAKKTVDVNKNDFPYIAGLIDAECCLGIYRYRFKERENFLYKTSLQLNNTKLPCFIFLVERFGGSLSFIAKKGNQNGQIYWKISGKELDSLLNKIHPFIQTKKPVCEELIKFRKLVLHNGGARHTDTFRSSYRKNLTEREKIFKKTKQLNLRGFKSV